MTPRNFIPEGQLQVPSDRLQKVFEEIFAPIGREVLKLDAAFGMIESVPFGTARGQGTTAWRQVAIALLVDALSINFDYKKRSVQREILETATQAGPSNSLGDEFRIACIERNAALCRIAHSIITGQPAISPIRASKKAPSVAEDDRGHSAGPRSAKEQSPASIHFAPYSGEGRTLQSREWAMISLAGKFPERILPLDGVRQIIDLRLMLGQGADLIDKLHLALRRSSRRTRNKGPFKLDEILLVMAQHWTNPDYPLWLMREPAATKVMQVVLELANNDGKLTDGFKDRRKKHFVTSGKFPILDAVTAKDRSTGESHFVQFTFRSDLKLR